MPKATQCVAFLRAVNVGKRQVKMAELKTHFEELGLDRVFTFIASGNVIFHTTRQLGNKLERVIEAQLERRLGFKVDTFLRTSEEVAEILRYRPFPDMQESNTLHVCFLKEQLKGDTADALERIRTPLDAFHVKGREFYWWCKTKISESKVWELPETRAVKLPVCTMRNITSLRKLATKHGIG